MQDLDTAMKESVTIVLKLKELGLDVDVEPKEAYSDLSRGIPLTHKHGTVWRNIVYLKYYKQGMVVFKYEDPCLRKQTDLNVPIETFVQLRQSQFNDLISRMVNRHESIVHATNTYRQQLKTIREDTRKFLDDIIAN